MTDFDKQIQSVKKQFEEQPKNINECYIKSTYLYASNKRIEHTNMTVQKLNEWLK